MKGIYMLPYEGTYMYFFYTSVILSCLTEKISINIQEQ